jgi:allene oxide cyclase
VNATDHTPPTTSSRRRPWGPVAALAAAALIGAVATTATSTSAAGAAPSAAPAAVSNPRHHVTVLRFAVRFSDHYVVDVPPAGKNADDVGLGDYAVFSDELLDRKGRVVGTEGGSGLITKVSATEAQVFFTLAIQLPHGQITASGLSSPAPSKQLALTGGTGRYVGARGSLDLVENGNGTGSLVLTLQS